MHGCVITISVPLGRLCVPCCSTPMNLFLLLLYSRRGPSHPSVSNPNDNHGPTTDPKYIELRYGDWLLPFVVPYCRLGASPQGLKLLNHSIVSHCRNIVNKLLLYVQVLRLYNATANYATPFPYYCSGLARTCRTIISPEIPRSIYHLP
jgi:hypothetical protein